LLVVVSTLSAPVRARVHGSGAKPATHGAEEDEGGPGPRTVVVNCAAGQSVNEALRKSGTELTIEVRGVCHEDVEVRRDNVTLRGRSPDEDGLRGVGGGDQPAHGVLLVRDARNVRIENLLVTGGARGGIVADHTNRVVIANCRVTDHTTVGIGNLYSGVVVQDTVIEGGTGNGLGDFNGQTTFCLRCTIGGFRLSAVVGVLGSRPLLDQSSVAGNVLAQDGARVRLTNSSVQAPGFALVARRMGAIEMTDGTLTGATTADDKGLITLRNVVQSVPSGHFAGVDSTLRAVGTTALAGNVNITRFSTFLLEDQSQLGGNLSCASGGNAYCADPSRIAGNTTGCALCVKP
jgi:hypothetical protein